MEIRKCLTLPLVILKLCLIYFVTLYAYRTLADEDVYYEHRGKNLYCQQKCLEASCKTTEKLCTQGKFNKFVYLYLDSLPMDLFDFENEFTKGNSKIYLVKHSGISDSGPVFSSVSTGKISNKYEGSINHLDNLFSQFKNAGFRIKAFGYNYPIYEMLGVNSFESYRNNGEGFHGAFCTEFLNLKEITVDDMSVTESLVTNHTLLTRFFRKEYAHFKTVLSKRKSELFKCLKLNFEDQMSVFLYDVYSDTIGHEFSRQSKIYMKKIAALKANLDILLEFIQINEPETVVMILSDHGVVGSLWETEISNHGNPVHANESFLFLFNTRFIRTEFDERSSLSSVHVPAIFAQLLANVNFPMNYLGIPPPVSKTLYHQMMTLRAKEGQALGYLESFADDVLKGVGLDLKTSILNSPFTKFTYMIEQKHNFDGEKSKRHIHEYEEYVRELDNWLRVLNDAKNTEGHPYQYIFNIVLLLLFLFEAYFSVFFKVKEFPFLFTWTFLIFLSMPLFFLIRSEVVENSFIYLQFLVFGIILAYAVFYSREFEFAVELQYKISALIVFSFALVSLNELVNRNNAFFMFYQNKYLQPLIGTAFLLWSVFLFVQINPRQGLTWIRHKLKMVWTALYFGCDASALIYELILMLSSNYFQSIEMQKLAQCFYVLFGILFISTFFWGIKKEILLIGLVSKLVFWFGHNYLRIVCFIVFLPFAFFFKNLDRRFKNEGDGESVANYRKIINFGLTIYTIYFIFHVTKGRFDTNISVRAGNRNWGLNIEEYPLFTAVVFMINKFLIFLIGFFVMIYLSKRKSEFANSQKSFWGNLIGAFDSVFVKMSESWYFMTILVYLTTFKSVEHQRGGMMLYTSGIILILVSYLFALSSAFVSRGCFHTSQKYDLVATGEMITRTKSMPNLVK